MSSQLKKYDVIYAGNYTKDTLITPDGTNVVNGGGMNYAANVGMRLGVSCLEICGNGRKGSCFNPFEWSAHIC